MTNGEKVKGWLGSFVHSYLLKRNRLVIYYDQYGKEKKMARAKACYGINIKLCEAYNLILLLESVQKVQGAYAEAGVYRGGTAELIAKEKGDRTLHLFDTFDKMPPIGEHDDLFDPTTHEGVLFETSLEEVAARLKPYPHIVFHKGFFPDSAKDVAGPFAFVHLDLDLYRSTKDALAFFYPKMTKGGVIVSHDYNSPTDGVKLAFQEFLKEKPEPIFELSGSQCFIVKT